ncbi:hypothetical protein SAMN05216332_10923 [Nitrosospira briensis]|nr:hypothetical protein SAMN05216332_10923 [Nitrosospira briensis]
MNELQSHGNEHRYLVHARTSTGNRINVDHGSGKAGG